MFCKHYLKHFWEPWNVFNKCCIELETCLGSLYIGIIGIWIWNIGVIKCWCQSWRSTAWHELGRRCSEASYDNILFFHVFMFCTTSVKVNESTDHVILQLIKNRSGVNTSCRRTEGWRFMPSGFENSQSAEWRPAIKPILQWSIAFSLIVVIPQMSCITPQSCSTITGSKLFCLMNGRAWGCTHSSGRTQDDPGPSLTNGPHQGAQHQTP